MCGIIGYVGTGKTADILMRSLKLLEYRGYDSSGVAFCCGKNTEIYKCTDRVSVLEKKIQGRAEGSHCAIGHTRWATHGSVSEKNAHPHRSGRVTLVHNGIIENYKELIQLYHLKEKLVSTGDSEVAAALIDRFYDEDPLKAIREASKQIRGTYALVMMFEGREDEIFAVCKVSPIVIAQNEEGRILASDLSALTGTYENYFVLPEDTIVRLSMDDLCLYDLSGKKKAHCWKKMEQQDRALDKKGHPYYMEKEIFEQGTALRNTLEPRIREGLPDFSADGIEGELFASHHHVVICACGTSYHAGLLAKRVFESFGRIKCDVFLSSEFIYEKPFMEKDALIIVISQSGETIDSLQALKIAKEEGHETLAIVNVRDSSIARNADYVLYTHAGMEIAVASTKAYTSQLSLLYLLAYRFALCEQERKEEVMEKIRELKKVPDAIEAACRDKERYAGLAGILKDEKDLYMIGRGRDYPLLMEAALKMKEISYIHCEAYAAGELKHGPIALIEKDTPVIACISQEDLLGKAASNIKEVRARGARVYAFVRESLAKQLDMKIEVFPLKDLEDELMPFSAIAAFQLLAYYTALEKGVDVDKPRNLAKVVTVE